MRKIKWNEGWKFWPDRDSFALVWTVPENAREVTLPHDAMLEKAAHPESPNGSNTGFRDGENLTYVKLFRKEKEWEGKRIQVRFDGVYMNALVYLNGQFVAKSPFGYTGFYADLTDLLREGENELRVQVRAGAMTNSRWYSGAGIYRDVWLYVLPPVHVLPEGIFVRTEGIRGETAVLSVCAELKNDLPAARDVILKTRILSPKGEEAAVRRDPVFLPGGESRTQTLRLTVRTPELWDEEHPALYRAETTLFLGEELLDREEDSFGIRTLSADPVNGLRINGKEVKLRGACIHHDNGLLGAATYYEAEQRRVRLLKEAGFNAIRMAHHPASPLLLRACDEMGMYVMDELTDMWNRLKSDYDYGLFFREWWKKDLTAMVRKDRNRPSVILYSIGNEIPEIGTDGGSVTAHEIAEAFRSLDPTRFTTAGINGVFAAGDHVPEIVRDVAEGLSEEEKAGGNVNDFMTLMDGHMDEIVTHPRVSERLEKAAASLDIVGYNYMTARYEQDGKDYPHRVIVGSETNPPEIARNWSLVKRLPYVIGDFTWTGWDYIGEAGVGIPAYAFGEGGFGAQYPAQLAFCGDIDITGFRRPASYFREVVFGFRTEPYLAVQRPEHYGEKLIKTPWVISDAIPSWSFPGFEGKPVIVEIYAPGEEAELLLNGRSLGRKPSGESVQFRTLFETVYEPGELTAVVYEKGEEISRKTLCTAGEAVRLGVEKESFGGEELTFYRVTLQDEKGRPVMGRDLELTLLAAEEEELLMGSGDPKPLSNYTERRCRTYLGRAQIIVVGKTAGFTVQAENGLTAEVR